MRLKICWLAGIIGATMAIITGTTAGAETCTLQLVRLEPLHFDESAPALPTDLACRVVQCRYFFFDQLSGRSRGYEADGFRSLVKNEPKKYQAERPVRGLTQLGSDRYAFVLDSKDAKSKGYDRLYFDLNHNGDLTDDKPIEAEERQQKVLLPPDFVDPLFSDPGFDALRSANCSRRIRRSTSFPART